MAVLGILLFSLSVAATGPSLRSGWDLLCLLLLFFVRLLLPRPSLALCCITWASLRQGRPCAVAGCIESFFSESLSQLSTNKLPLLSCIAEVIL